MTWFNWCTEKGKTTVSGSLIDRGEGILFENFDYSCTKYGVSMQIGKLQVPGTRMQGSMVRKHVKHIPISLLG